MLTPTVPTLVEPPVEPQVPTMDPHCSSHSPFPSHWKSLLDGVEFMSCTEQAVAELKAASAHWKSQCITASDKCHHVVLEMQENLTASRPVFIAMPTSTISIEATMTNLPFANEEEISLFNKAFAASLAFPLVNAKI